MPNQAPSKWDQFALLTFLSKEIGGQQSFGKKALQKTVHLAQEMLGLETGYKFTLYTYGPYSSSITGDLDVLRASDAVDVSYNLTDNFYHIAAAQNAHTILERGKDFLDRNSDELKRVVGLVKGKSARDLELYSTIIFFYRRGVGEGNVHSSELLKAVKELKPKYSEAELTKAAEIVAANLAA